MVWHVSISFSFGGEEVADFQKKRLSPIDLYVCMSLTTTLYRNSRILRRYHRKTIKARDLKFCISPRLILKAKSTKFQVQTPSGRWFFRYPFFNFYTIVYNSAGKFSTTLKTFSSGRVLRLSIEQGASPPVIWSRGAAPPSSRGLRPREEGVFPRSRLPAL